MHRTITAMKATVVAAALLAATLTIGVPGANAATDDYRTGNHWVQNTAQAQRALNQRHVKAKGALTGWRWKLVRKPHCIGDDSGDYPWGPDGLFHLMTCGGWVTETVWVKFNYWATGAQSFRTTDIEFHRENLLSTG